MFIDCFMLFVRLLVNSRRLLVNLKGNQKSHTYFWLLRGAGRSTTFIICEAG